MPTQSSAQSYKFIKYITQLVKKFQLQQLKKIGEKKVKYICQNFLSLKKGRVRLNKKLCKHDLSVTYTGTFPTVLYRGGPKISPLTYESPPRMEEKLLPPASYKLAALQYIPCDPKYWITIYCINVKSPSSLNDLGKNIFKLPHAT